MTSSREESVELLNATHSFPCEMTFKVIGKATGTLLPSVLAVFRKFTRDSQEPACSTRNTPAGRHVSITVVAFMRNADDVLDVYDELKDLDDVVMLL